MRREWRCAGWFAGTRRGPRRARLPVQAPAHPHGDLATLDPRVDLSGSQECLDFIAACSSGPVLSRALCDMLCLVAMLASAIATWHDCTSMPWEAVSTGGILCAWPRTVCPKLTYDMRSPPPNDKEQCLVESSHRRIWVNSLDDAVSRQLDPVPAASALYTAMRQLCARLHGSCCAKKPTYCVIP